MAAKEIPLEDYLAGSSKTEEAHDLWLIRISRTLMLNSASLVSAKRERSAALELAHDYRPAQDLKF